jgi:hypothetical protein
MCVSVRIETKETHRIALLGGLGNDFVTWSMRGRASVPF